MADGTDNLGQDEVEELLRQAASHRQDESLGQDQVEELLKQAADGGAHQPAKSLDQDQVEELLRQASGQPASANDALGQDQVEELLRQVAEDPHSPHAQRNPNQVEQPRAAAEPAPLENLGQDQIEELLRQSGNGPPATQPIPSDSAVATEQAAPRSPTAVQMNDDVDLLLAQAEQALQSIDEPVQAGVEGLAPFELRDLTGSRPNTQKASLSLLRDVELDLRIELGRTHMYLEDVLQLRKGTVVPLDKLAGDPVDIFVNGRLVARGEVLVLNDNFCVRVADLVSGEEVA